MINLSSLNVVENFNNFMDSTDYGQIVIYVFARVMLALAKLAIQPNMHPLSSLITPEARTQITNNAYPVFASMTWAMVMYIFRWYPETLASSLRSSMVYMYVVEYQNLDFGMILLTYLVMVIRTIGILCARFWCITSELRLLFLGALWRIERSFVWCFESICIITGPLIRKLCIMRRDFFVSFFSITIYTYTFWTLFRSCQIFRGDQARAAS